MGKVAANVFSEFAGGGDAPLRGVARQVQRSDRTWSRTQSLDAVSYGWAAIAAPPTIISAADELAALLAWACESEVISEEDRSLLCLAATADGASSVTRRRRPALMGTRFRRWWGRRSGCRR